jgi:DNA-binding response OmpR family regulator
MRVLIIEDEIRLVDNVAAALREGAGLAVDCCHDGLDGVTAAESGSYDMILVDIMLPGLDGFGVVRLLNAGADDYLTKPFDVGELLARVKALIRRGKGVSHPEMKLGRLTLNTVEQTLRCSGHLVDVSPTEYRIMEYLMFRPRAIVSQRQILEHLYDFTWEHHSNVVEAHISNLRKKLRRAGEANAVETLRGRGYRLEAPEATT